MVKPKNKHSLSHVRHDPAHCLAPGLFRALKRGERKRSKLDVTYDYGDGKRIEFSGPEPLGADDLRILQGLVAMAGPNGLVLGPEPKTEGGRQLRLFLGHCCKVSDEAAFCLIQRPYISKTLLTRRISPRGSP